MMACARGRAGQLAAIDSTSFRMRDAACVSASLLAVFVILGWVVAQPMLGILGGVTAVGMVAFAQALLGGSEHGTAAGVVSESHVGRSDG